MEHTALVYNSLFDPLVKGFNDFAPKLPSAVIILVFGLLFIRVLSWVIEALIGLIRLPGGFKGILMSFANGLLWVFLIITVLRTLGLDSIALVFTGSVAALGLAIAGGATSLTSDIMGGLFLARDKDFRVGDLVKAGDGTEGVIESMDMRRTRIRGKEGNLHVIPNSVIERKEWVLIKRKKEMQLTEKTKK